MRREAAVLLRQGGSIRIAQPTKLESAVHVLRQNVKADSQCAVSPDLMASRQCAQHRRNGDARQYLAHLLVAPFENVFGK